MLSRGPAPRPHNLESTTFATGDSELCPGLIETLRLAVEPSRV